MLIKGGKKTSKTKKYPIYCNFLKADLEQKGAERQNPGLQLRSKEEQRSKQARSRDHQTGGLGQWAERAPNATEIGIQSQYTKENPETGPRLGQERVSGSF